MLVLGVGTFIAFLKFQDMKNAQETIMANTVGSQIKQIGQAVNRYISIRYDKLSTLTAATGTGTDPGPRTCNGSGCEITYQTLINEGLLPSTYTGVNAIRSGYKIWLRRDGTSPNYVINGLITTVSSWTEGGKTRYDLLGRSMQVAGVDSGMTRSSTTASGYNGQWSEESTTFSNITKEGLLAYRVGYDSAMYSVYLRRDGTLPMTGDLNMGGNSINNANNITALGTSTAAILISTGVTSVGSTLTVGGSSTFAGAMKVNNTITSTGNITAGGQVIGHNGVGDAYVIGGSDANDYEFRLGSNKPLTLWRSGGSSSETRFQVWGTQSNAGDFVIAPGSDGNTTGSITASGNIKGKALESTGRTTVGEFLQVNGWAAIGDACSPNGLQGHASSGMPIYCVDGKWQSIGSMVRIVTVSQNAADAVTMTCNSNEVAVGGGGKSNNGVGFTDVQGKYAAPGIDISMPAGAGTTGVAPTGTVPDRWVLSGVHNATNNPENLVGFVVCMRKW
uniref:hypothetical protein n=1 Tax=Citrobacter koseri TaxID=545 RepID=UPI0038928CB4